MKEVGTGEWGLGRHRQQFTTAAAEDFVAYAGILPSSIYGTYESALYSTNFVKAQQFMFKQASSNCEFLEIMQ